MIFLALFCCLCFSSITALYEDQVDQIDWYRSLIGPVDIIVPDSKSEDSNKDIFYSFSSTTSAVTAFDGISGSLVWRKVLQSTSTKHGSFNALSLIHVAGDNAITLRDSNGFDIHANLFSVHTDNDEVVVTSYDSIDGLLIYQKIFIIDGDIIRADFVAGSGKKLLIIGSSKEIILIDAKSGREENRVSGHILDIGFDEINKKLVYLSPKTVSEISLSTAKQTVLYEGDFKLSKFSKRKKELVLASVQKGILSLYSFSQQKLEKVKEVKDVKSVRSLREIEYSLKPTDQLVVNEDKVLFISEEITVNDIKNSKILGFSPILNDVVLGDMKRDNIWFPKSKISFSIPQRSMKYEDLSFIASRKSVLIKQGDTFTSLNMRSQEKQFVNYGELTSLVGKPLIIDHTLYSSIDGNLSIEANEDDLSDQIYMKRLESQLSSISKIFWSIFISIQDVFEEILLSKGLYFLDMYRGDLEAKLYSVEEKSNFGFIRNIVVLSSRGTLFGFNSDTGDITFVLPLFDEDEGIKNVFVDVVHLKNNQVGVFLTTKYFIINGLTGTLVKTIDFEKSFHLFKVFSLDSSDLVLVSSNDKMKVIGQVTDKDKSENLFYLKFEKKTQSVSGYQVLIDTKQAVQKFTFRLAEGYEFLEVIEHENDVVNTVGRNIGGGKVMIKYISSSTVVILSHSQTEDNIFVQVVSMKSGEVFETYYLENCDTSSIATVFFENNFILSCFSQENLRTEVLSLSIFYDTVFEKFDLNPFKSVSSSLKNIVEKEEVVIYSNSYFMSKKVSNFEVTKTQRGIAEKRVLCVLENGQIGMLDKRMFDPRRPSGTMTKEEKEEGLVPYSPFIFFNSVAVLSHKNVLEQIQNIEAFPTKLESTCLLFATGLDIYFTRLQPSSGFDLLPEEFNFALLIFMVCGLSVAVYFLNNAIKDKKLREQWK